MTIKGQDPARSQHFDEHDRIQEDPPMNRRTLVLAFLVCLVLGVGYVLVSTRANTARFDSPLHEACYNGDLSAAQRIVDGGANIDLQGPKNARDTALILAVSAQRNRVALVRLLLEHNANVKLTDDVGRSPLTMAVMFGDMGVVQMLLDHGADINEPDREGHRPLSYVGIWSVDKPMKAYLIAHGAR